MMIQIPEILQKKEYRFIPVSKTKEPIQKEWNTINNYTYDNDFLNEKLRQGYNYGILSKYGNLCFLDFDDIKTYNKVKPELPKTLTIKTGKGYHLYYKMMNVSSQKIKDDTGKQVIEIFGVSSKGTPQFVVAPNSIHETGEKYKILQEIEPIDLPPPELTRTIRKLVSSFSFPFCSFSKNTIRQKDYNTEFQPSYCYKENRFDLKICYNNQIKVKVFAVIPNLSLQYKDRKIIIFSYNGKFYWKDLNKTNQYILENKFGENPYFWTNKEITLEAMKNAQGQKNSLTLVVR